MDYKSLLDPIFQDYLQKLDVLATERNKIISEFIGAVEAQKIQDIREILGIPSK
jgi:hypothetical protein